MAKHRSPPNNVFTEDGVDGVPISRETARELKCQKHQMAPTANKSAPCQQLPFSGKDAHTSCSYRPSFSMSKGVEKPEAYTELPSRLASDLLSEVGASASSDSQSYCLPVTDAEAAPDISFTQPSAHFCLSEASGPTTTDTKSYNDSSIPENRTHNVSKDLSSEMVKTQTSSPQRPMKTVLKNPSQRSATARGARPKTSVSSSTRRIHWSDTVETAESIDEGLYNQYRNILTALRIPEESVPSSTISAVNFMLGRDNGEHDTLITLAVNMLRVKLNHYPNVKNLYSTLMEHEFNEKSIVTAFIQEYSTERGQAIVDALMNKSVSSNHHQQQQQDEQHQQQQQQQPNGQNQQQQSHQEQVQLESQYCEQHQLQQQQQQQQQLMQIHDAARDNDQAVVEDRSSSISTSRTIAQSNDVTSELEQSHVKKSIISSLQSVKDSHQPSSQNVLKGSVGKDMQIKALQREHEYLKQRLTCVSCKVRPTEVVFLPCGHVSLCSICSDSQNVCPICHKVALGEVKIYMG